MASKQALVRMFWRRLPLLGLCASLALSACNCEHRLRKALSDGGDRKGEQLKEEKRSSTPKDVEPNEQPSAATPIKLTGELRAILGKLERSDDVDWFALSHDSDSAEPWLLEVIVEPKAQGLDLAIELEIEGQPSGALYNLSGPDQAESIPVVALEGAPIRLAVRSRAGFGDYAVRFKRRLSGGAIEAEPNDVIAQAWPFNAPGEIQGFYDRPGDRDVFAVKLPSPAPEQAAGVEGIYSVQVSGLDSSPQAVELMTSPEQTVPWATMFVPAGDAASTLPNLRVPGGVSTLWVALSGGKNTSREQAYRLKWLPHPPLAPGQLLEAEPNDEPIGATMLPSHDVLVQGYLHHAQDRDVFKLALASQPALIDPATPAPQPKADMGAAAADPAKAPIDLFDETAKAAAPSEEGGGAQAAPEDPYALERPPVLDLPALKAKVAPKRLVDLVAKPLQDHFLLRLAWLDGPAKDISSQAPVKKASAALCAQPLQDEDVHFVISSAHQAEDEPKDRAHTGPDYALQVRVRQPSPGQELEPNDERASADGIALDPKLKPSGQLEGMISREGDQDVYALDLAQAPQAPDAAGQWLHHVTISLENHPLNLKLMIYDQDGIALTGPEGINKSGAGGQERFVADWPQGRYFVVVSAVSGALCEPYKLNMAIGAKP